ncbi:MAG TPA: RNA polymerase factor sigma-54 [Gemmataceae bacterium]|nr:RNA polymerase factor sigma-54 [Gemmataceae bacterium]
MRLDTTMNQRMVQTMHLAPRMIQSMEILQLPIMALQERIQQELQENPVLELMESSDEPAADGDFELDGQTADDSSDPGDGELIIDDSGSNELDFDRLEALSRDWGDVLNEEHRPSRGGMDEEGDKKHDAMQNMAARPQSLQEYLNEQLSFLELKSEHAELARYLITHIDDNGFLTTLDETDPEYQKLKHDPDYEPSRPLRRCCPKLEDLAEGYRPGTTMAQIEEALHLLQKLDPPGVGARDLRECLLLQLTPETPHAKLLRALITNHLDNIQHNRLPIIQKETGADLSTIKDAIEVLRHFNPKPGSQFTADNIPYVVPDISVERQENGEYSVRLLDDWLPSIYISRRYIDMYREKGADPKIKDYLKRKIQSAQWLQESIEQRRHTLEKVTKAIIQRQRAFLDKGPEHIEPLKMQQIADQVGVHVTTVSRAVDDKWVQTPRGIFPLKRFFGGGTHNTTTGEEVAWETIKQKLLEIIDREDKSSPLSDEDLVTKLNEAGYPVKRRTVTKYRKMANIPSSRQRKDWTSAQSR